MADKVENKNMEDAENENLDETLDENKEDVEDTTAEKQDKTKKSENMIPVSSLKARLARQKEGYEAQISDLSEQIAEYESTLKSIIEDLKKDLPEDYLELLEDASLTKQFRVLSKKLQAKKDMKPTPKPNGDGKKQTIADKPLASWK